MTYSIEGIPATQTELVRAVQSLASTVKGIELQLVDISNHLSQLSEIDTTLRAMTNAVDDASGKR